MASNAPLGHVGFLGHPYLFHVALSSSLHVHSFLFFYLLILIISFQPRQVALLLYKIANSSTVYGCYLLLIFPIIPFAFLLQFSFQSFPFQLYGYKKGISFYLSLSFFPSMIYLTLLNYAFFWICLIHLNLFMDRKIESCYQRVI